MLRSIYQQQIQIIVQLHGHQSTRKYTLFRVTSVKEDSLTGYVNSLEGRLSFVMLLPISSVLLLVLSESVLE